MFNKIKNKLDRELRAFIRDMDKRYSLSKVSPLLISNIRDFVLRDGKRLRPILFIAGYTGFAKRIARGLYTSALSLELLHDFMLVHDDIIDKSDTRRGRPSMHRMLEACLGQNKKTKFDGKDLAIVVGDVMYALAINAFLAIEEKMARKEEALKKFIEAAMYTGGGEFIELLLGLKELPQIKRSDIFKVYDFKTAYYSFASPLATGAILAGASPKQVNGVFAYGIQLGRAFQIQDDILGMFGEEKKIGKPLLTDLQEGKKTILVWLAYRYSNQKNKTTIRRILAKNNVDRTDLAEMKQAIVISGALGYAQHEIVSLIAKAKKLLASSNIRPAVKGFLNSYADRLLAAPVTSQGPYR